MTDQTPSDARVRADLRQSIIDKMTVAGVILTDAGWDPATPPEAEMIADAVLPELAPIVDRAVTAEARVVNLRATMGERIAAAEKIAADVMGERDAAEARVAAALRLCDEWEQKAGEDSSARQVYGPQVVSVPFVVEKFRAALAAAPAPEPDRLTVMQTHAATDCPDRDRCWARDIHDEYAPRTPAPEPATCGHGRTSRHIRVSTDHPPIACPGPETCEHGETTQRQEESLDGYIDNAPPDSEREAMEWGPF